MFTQRIDLPVYYTEQGWRRTTRTATGKPGLATGSSRRRISRPRSPRTRSGLTGARFVFPTGGKSPFGGSQYQVAPYGGPAVLDARAEADHQSAAALFLQLPRRPSTTRARCAGSTSFRTVTFGFGGRLVVRALAGESHRLQRRDEQVVRGTIDALLIKRLNKSMGVRLRRRIRASRRTIRSSRYDHQRPRDVLLLIYRRFVVALASKLKTTRATQKSLSAQLSPFELKDNLIHLAKETSAAVHRHDAQRRARQSQLDRHRAARGFFPAGQVRPRRVPARARRQDPRRHAGEGRASASASRCSST